MEITNPIKTEHKKTCAVCGFPRQHHLQGIPYTPCKNHCGGCRQPLNEEGECFFCCDLCSSFPCVCVPVWTTDVDEGGHCGCGEMDCNSCNPNNAPKLPEGKTWTGKGKSGYATDHLTPGWEAAGIKVFPHQNAAKLYDSLQDAWPNMRCNEVDPVQRAADFYLLSAMTSGVLNGEGAPVAQAMQWHPEWTGAQREAREALDELVEDTDKSFVEYIDMACGGELRHHSQVGGKHLNGNRASAWIEWRTLREIRGVEALMDAYWLFMDFSASGYGGPLWAGAAQLLYKRLKGQVSKEVFVDQTFSLVHNGGVFLNKQHWSQDQSGRDLNFLKKKLLPAQSRDEWPLMLSVSSRRTQGLWREVWRDTNKARCKCGARPTICPSVNGTKILWCRMCNMDPRKGHRAWDCRNGEFVVRKDKTDVNSTLLNYKQPSWIDGTLILYDKLEYSVYPQNTWAAPCSLKQALDLPRKWRGKASVTFNDTTIWMHMFPKEDVEWTWRELLDLMGQKYEIRQFGSQYSVAAEMTVKNFDNEIDDDDYTDE